jgi:hypothetical protein
MFVKTFPISDLERTHGPSLETTQQVLSSLQKDGVCVLQHLIPKDIASKKSSVNSKRKKIPVSELSSMDPNETDRN